MKITLIETPMDKIQPGKKYFVVDEYQVFQCVLAKDGIFYIDGGTTWFLEEEDIEAAFEIKID